MTFDPILYPGEPIGVDSPLPWRELTSLRLPQPLSALARADSLGTPRWEAEMDGSSPGLESLVEISSGGSVFFCVFQGDRVAVLKFVSDRLMCQSEVFATQIAAYLGINGPQCRIMQPDSDEWSELKAACYALYADNLTDDRELQSILQCLEKQHSLIVMEYISGPPLLASKDAIQDVEKIAYPLGQILALDMVLGNPDRLAVKRLGWPGNPHNILFGLGGRHDQRVVCIDAVVQRKPPQTLTSIEDRSCEELAELAFNDIEFVRSVLEDALFDNSQLGTIAAEVTVDSAEMMQRGMIATWQKASDLRGIFETMLRNIDEWIGEFVDDMDISNESSLNILPTPAPGSALSPRTRRTPSRTSLLTGKIRMIQKEAGRDELMTIKLEIWNEVLKGRMDELLSALEEWVIKREGGSSDGNEGKEGKEGRRFDLTTSFLNPHTARPFVDLYELGLRLRHILRRLAILASALSSSTPSRLAEIPPAGSPSTSPLSRVFIGGAVAANSFHVLRSLNITHFLNATEDLFLTGASAEYIEQEFKTLRIPLRDDEDEDIEPHFFSAAAFIENAVNDGGHCLIHCHAGQSRSCALVIAWLLLYKSFNLRDAVQLVQRARPSAAPNAGYMRALGRLEERTCGSKSQIDKIKQLKKKKPEALECPECGEVVGISQRTLDYHMTRKHNA